MNFAQIKEIAKRGGVVCVGGYCVSGRHSDVPPSYIKPVLVSEKLVRVGDIDFSPGDSVERMNSDDGDCCQLTIEESDDTDLLMALKEPVLGFKRLGGSLPDLILQVEKLYNQQ